MKTKVPATFFILFLFTLLTSPLHAGINTDTALTPAERQLIVRTQTRYVQKTDDKTGQEREMRTWMIPLVMVYGFRDGTAGFVKIPYLEKGLKTNSKGQRVERESSGIGDIELFFKQRIWRKDQRAATSRVALLGGVKLPSGEDDESDGLGRLPVDVQLGSGSLDPFFGFVATRQTQAYEITSDFVYHFRTEANDFKFGDELHHNIGAWFRIWPRKLPEMGVPSYFNLVLEANGLWAQRDRDRGERVRNSGGYLLQASPGFQYVTRQMIAELSFQYPLIQILNGAQLEKDWEAIASFRWAF